MGVRGDGFVVALEDAGYAVEFEPAAWFKVAVTVSGEFSREVYLLRGGAGVGPGRTGRARNKRNGGLLESLVYKPRKVAYRGDEIP